ncbi:MAG: diguanylate cyclase, partial [Zoogloea sp.]|nr:diguanylate cyclase [Zoogloea sp.]
MAANPLIATTLPRAPEPAGRNAEALSREGLEHLRRLAGHTWTDHNIHDPGITTLELVTWALAELGYRADLPLADLLTPPQGAPLTLADQFHRARQVLPVRPLTALDWRKLLIDLPGVKNAWITSSEAPPLYADQLRRTLLRSPPAHP